MYKTKEHILRWFENIPKRIWATMVSFFLLVGTVALLYISLNIVLVTDSMGNRKMLVTSTQDPVELMNLSGIVAQQYDEYYYTSYTSNLANLNIQRAFPVVVMADGVSQTAYMTNGTVQNVLEQSGVALGEHDYTEPSLYSAVTENSTITVHRVEYRDTVAEEIVPFGTEIKYSSLLHRFKNRSYTLSDGSNGLNNVTYRERVVDGVVESSQQMAVEQVVAAQNTVVLQYGAGSAVSGIDTMPGVEIVNNAPTSYSKVITNARCSAYSARRGRGSSGLGLYAGTIAVNPNVIPYGSKLYITSADGSFVYGYAIATDTGTALMEGIIVADLFYDTYLESTLHGIKHLNIYVLN